MQKKEKKNKISKANGEEALEKPPALEGIGFLKLIITTNYNRSMHAKSVAELQ